MIYAENIMRFRAADRLDQAVIDQIRLAIKFVGPEMDMRALRGLLTLELPLSMTAKRGASEPDDTLMGDYAYALGLHLAGRD